MGLKLLIPPVHEPITIDEMKTYLRVDGNELDDYLPTLISSAREYVESYQNCSLVTQTWELILDSWPDWPLSLPRSPVQKVESIRYMDKHGTEHIWEATNYLVDADSDPGRVTLARGISVPAAELVPIGGIRVRYVAGYGSPGQLPQRTKLAIKMLAAHWVESIEAILDSDSTETEYTISALLGQEKGLRDEDKRAEAPGNYPAAKAATS